MTRKTHAVEIPQHYLLILAARGNMGNDEVPALMRLWAEKECERLGLMAEMVAEQERNLRALEERVENVLGKEGAKQVKAEISRAIDTLKGR